MARGGTRELANLRRGPRVTLVVQRGGEWVAVEGRADLAEDDRVVLAERRTAVLVRCDRVCTDPPASRCVDR